MTYALNSKVHELCNKIEGTGESIERLGIKEAHTALNDLGVMILRAPRS